MVTITDDAAILSAAAAVLLAAFTVIQLKHMEKHRNVDISMKLFEWAETDRLRKAFKWVDQNFHFEKPESYLAVEKEDDEAGDYPHQVTAFYEQVGFLVEKKFVDLDVVVDRLGSHIISNWQKLEPWITAMRKKKGDETFGEHFQRLYQRTVTHLKKNR